MQAARTIPTVKLNGILQPLPSQKTSKRFQLLTEERLYQLDTPRKFMELFEKHEWERFSLKGYLLDDGELRVLRANLDFDLEEGPSLQDLTRTSDLRSYNRKINSGYSIEPSLEEIA